MPSFTSVVLCLRAHMPIGKKQHTSPAARKVFTQQCWHMHAPGPCRAVLGTSDACAWEIVKSTHGHPSHVVFSYMPGA